MFKKRNDYAIGKLSAKQILIINIIVHYVFFYLFALSNFLQNVKCAMCNKRKDFSEGTMF